MNRRIGVVAAAVLLGACDYPTELPRWEQTWVVPAEAVSVRVADLLPTGIGVTADGSAFVATTTGIHVSTSLGEICPPCAAGDGAVLPKPEFTATIPASTSFPDDLVAAVLAGGSLEVELVHEFSFDPLRPGGATGARGFVVLTVTSDGAAVARDSLSGDDRAFPANTPLRATLAVQPVTAANTLGLEVRLHSPAGDPAPMRADDRLTVSVAPAELRIAEVTVRATGLDVEPTRTSLDFDIDTTMLDRIRSGALRIRTQNPWNLSGNLVIRFEFDGRAIERNLAVQPGEASQRIELSGQELRDILGASSVELVTAGHVSATDGTVTLTPVQELVVQTDFELVILVGGREDGI